MSSKNHEESGYGIDVGFTFANHDDRIVCFHILVEVTPLPGNHSMSQIYISTNMLWSYLRESTYAIFMYSPHCINVTPISVNPL